MSDDAVRCPHCGGNQIRNGVCRMCGYGREEEYFFSAKEKTNTQQRFRDNIQQVPDNNSQQIPVNEQVQIPVNQYDPQQPVNQYIQQPPVNLPNLVQCPDCGHMVSIYATACPTCGRPFVPLSNIVQQEEKEEREPEKRRINSIALFFGILLLIVGLYYAFNGGFQLGATGLK